jgi:outer membrane protein assembly factor BamB
VQLFFFFFFFLFFFFFFFFHLSHKLKNWIIISPPSTTNPGTAVGPTVGTAGQIFLSRGGTFDARRPEDGSLQWRFNDSVSLMRTPHFVDAGVLGLVRATAGRIEFVDEHTGVVVRALPLPAEFSNFVGHVTRFQGVLLLLSSTDTVLGVNFDRYVFFFFFFFFNF